MKIQYGPDVIEMHDGWSQRDFTNRPRISIPDGVNVYQSCFSQETPDSAVFRPTMVGVTFYNCNLDNVLIPPGNTVIGGTRNRFQAQNDGNDWAVDQTNKPVRPRDADVFAARGLALPDPKSIPARPVRDRVDLQAAALVLMGGPKVGG